MRLWTLHPKYLDARGLVALWREALLAQKVLRGLTAGYRAHPQLLRFREQSAPVACIARYLAAVHVEAAARGYRFPADKIARRRATRSFAETKGQLLYEWEHLRKKLRRRSPEQFARIKQVRTPEPHPLFVIVPGGVRDWERIGPASDSAKNE
jgi:hypothetical protein